MPMVENKGMKPKVTGSLKMTNVLKLQTGLNF